ncbi:hypothetical protein [uncultured Clostridium sp.]|uniref:hypothetical protein n=1 Tax=uncultured Clostridium sp. TaxID=59620 RepID=UPI0026291BD2|nr:hypothetical protein [uncultured Clostridium sp.]
MVAWNGELLSTWGLILLEDNRFDRFKKRRELIPINGRDGDLIIEDGSHDNLELYLKVFAEFENWNMEEVFTKLENWLEGTGTYANLEFEDGYIFSAKFLNITDIKQIYKSNFEFTINFSCKKIGGV